MTDEDPIRDYYVACRFCHVEVRADLLKCEACGRRLPGGGFNWRRLILPGLLFAVGFLFTPFFVLNVGGGRVPGPVRQLWSCESNEKNLGTAIEMYASDNHDLYPKSMKVLTPDYLHSIPTCPAAGRDTYSATYASQSGSQGYSFYCGGRNHPGAGMKESFPEYNSVQGLILQ